MPPLQMERGLEGEVSFYSPAIADARCFCTVLLLKRVQISGMAVRSAVSFDCRCVM